LKKIIKKKSGEKFFKQQEVRLILVKCNRAWDAWGIFRKRKKERIFL
jgi:hypothetical protein